MRIAVVNSSTDPAGTSIRKSLLSLMETDGAGDIAWGENILNFFETEGRLIYETDLDKRLDADLIVFISRHTSKNPFPALTVHVTGNYGEAALGGENRSLAAAAPACMHAVLNNLEKNRPEGYKVSYEVTHHGPTDIRTPSFFVEIGSTMTEWGDSGAAEAVALSVADALRENCGEVICAIGFGGNHYAARETGIALESTGAFGHIVHTRDIPLIDEDIIRLMAVRTGADAAYIDRKALRADDVRRIEEILNRMGMPVLSESELRSVAGIGWNTYMEIRCLAEETHPGCRIQVKRLEGRGCPEAVLVDEELVAEAIKANKNEFFGSIENIPAVCMYSADGTFLPIFITHKGNRVQLINDLITLCVKILQRQRGTTVEGDLLVLRKTRVDPLKAAELGVPKGPLLGRLASGSSVEINGNVIDPSMVLKVEEKFIRIPGLEGYI